MPDSYTEHACGCETWTEDDARDNTEIHYNACDKHKQIVYTGRKPSPVLETEASLTTCNNDGATCRCGKYHYYTTNPTLIP